MPTRELTIHIETEGELTFEQLEVIGRDAAKRILERHGPLGYDRPYGTPITVNSVRMHRHNWPSIRYPGEGIAWAITADERSNYEEEYDDDDF